MKDESLYREIVEQKRIFKFLLGLNNSLDEVRGRVLGTKPIPSIREVFLEVRREESRKKVMLGSLVKTEPNSNVTTADSSALVVKGPQHNSFENRPRRGRPWCDHCRKPGHTRETCWKLHGKPVDWKPTRSLYDKESRGNLVTGNEESRLFSKE